MTFDGQAELGYKLVELDGNADTEIPLNAKALEVWLSELPVLNINLLSYQVPKYIQEINQIKISDNQRFKILELLRPMVDHIYRELSKRFRSGNIDLSPEFKEMQWLINVMIGEMSHGYQRLLFNLAQKKPGWTNRGYYALLAERISYYLGERIYLSYSLCTAVPKNIWRELNSTYAYCQEFKLNSVKIKDEFAFHEKKKGSINSIYKRTLLLAMVGPYSLRGAKLEQIYYGFFKWIDSIKLLNKTPDVRSSFIIDLAKDSGPEFDVDSELLFGQLFIDNSELTAKSQTWLESGKAPSSANYKGLSKKLLQEVIHKLDGAVKRKSHRIRNDGEKVDVVIGLNKIDEFLNNNIFEKRSSASLADQNKQDKESLQLVEDPSEQLHFYTPETFKPQVQPQKRSSEMIITTKKQEKKWQIFTIENESEKGVCLSSSGLEDAVLFIGELMFIRGYDAETWTLGVIRWMTVENTQLFLGLYLLSSKVDKALVSKQASGNTNPTDVLWLGAGEHGDTLLLSNAEFKVGELLNVEHQGGELEIELTDVIWSSEGFSQFRFKVKNQNDVENQGFLIPE